MQRLVPNIDPSKLIADVQAKYPLVEEMAGWPQRFPSVDLVNDYLVVDEDGKPKSGTRLLIIRNSWLTEVRLKMLFTRIVINDSKLLSFTTDVLISLIGCGFVREVIFIILLKAYRKFWGMPVSGYVLSEMRL